MYKASTENYYLKIISYDKIINHVSCGVRTFCHFDRCMYLCIYIIYALINVQLKSFEYTASEIIG